VEALAVLTEGAKHVTDQILGWRGRRKKKKMGMRRQKRIEWNRVEQKSGSEEKREERAQTSTDPFLGETM
jgi:hypothetical protein